MALSFNLNSLMKRLVLPKGWAPKRLKAIRFGFINLAGRVVSRARQLIIRLSGGHPEYELLIEVRRRLRISGTQPSHSVRLLHRLHSYESKPMTRRGFCFGDPNGEICSF
jgi:hypothetical protein